MKNTRIAVMLLIASQLVACGMANNLTSDVYEGIKTVNINKTVISAKIPRIYGAGENAAIALGGVLGGLAASDSNMSKGQMLAKVLEKNNIDLRSKVYTGFNRKLKQNAMFSGKLVDAAADATFDLEITLYGLYASGPFSSKMEPEVQIRATLRRADGQKVWTNFGYVTAMNFSGHEYTMEEYLKDPAKLDRAYDAAIDKALTNLMESLKLAMFRDNQLLAKLD
jgi:hypothetical protein